MPRTLKSIQEQIRKLERQAEGIKAKEIPGVVARIRQAIEHYRLEPADLFGQAFGFQAKAAAIVAKQNGSARKRAAVAVKYRDGDGNTWTGRGSQPRWLRAAVAGGRKAEDFLV